MTQMQLPAASVSHYDFFISYKSEDIQIVRPVAEHLLANGLPVWFAEYQVLLAGRDRFQEAIEQGVRHCSWGICFTNDRYIASDYCRRELDELMEHCGPERIIEFRCPVATTVHARYPALKFAHSTDYDGLTQALQEIEQVSGFQTGHAIVEPSTPERRFKLSYGKECFSLDVADWQARKPWLTWLGGGDRRALTYRRASEDGRLWGHLLVGPMPVQVRRKQTATILDDRVYYDEALRFARFFYQSALPQTCLGVHLIFIPPTLSHTAVSSRFSRRVLARLYSVVMSRSGGQADLEFTFFFFVKGASYSFWRRAYLMDRLVSSFRWEED